MEPFLEGVLPALPFFDQKVIKDHRDVLVAASLWPQNDSIQFSKDVWEHIGGKGRREQLDSILREKPLRHLPQDHPFFGRSGGHCDENGINFHFEGTLDDPIYLAHETGHLVADHQGSASKNVAELQAYFLQEVAYDLMLTKHPELSNAVRIHRLQEYAVLGRQLYMADQLAQKTRPDNRDEDGTVFTAHRHAFACVMSLKIYKVFKGMSTQQKERALGVLFDSGSGASLEDILGAFRLLDHAKIKQTGQEFSQFLSSEADYFGFDLHRHAVTQVKGQLATVKL